MNTISVRDLMVRYGFLLEVREGEFHFIDRNKQNMLHFHHVNEKLAARNITLRDNMEEDAFVSILEELFESTGEMLYHFDNLALHTVDIYVRGLVMQLNRLGCRTTGSCDGHDHRNAHICFETATAAKKAAFLVQYVGLVGRVTRNYITFSQSRYEFPAFASKLAEITFEDADVIYEKNNPLMKKNNYYGLLEELLSIYGVSGEEADIRNFVIEQIEPYVDHLEVDYYGNILAQVRKGNGPTVLVNAHLDTVSNFVPSRTINKEGNIWSSSEGVLGADDRAGVCVLLAIAKTLQGTDFRGTLKFAFTVEEEVGLVGAKHVAKSFLWDVDMAFVVDRRGAGDIVTSCGGYIPFCTDRFARTAERIGNRIHRNRWKAVEGGSSDTRIWAELGINSINLSAGYQDEHTSSETLDIEANYGTYEFVMQLIEESRSLTTANLNRSNRNSGVQSNIG